MSRFLKWTLDHPVTVTMFYIALMIVGAICFYAIPIELSPHIELPKLTVSASWYNTSAVTIEAQVTAPLESAMQGLKGVTRILSRTYEGRCSITADFEKDANLQLAELELNEKINQLKKKLPKGVSWPSIQRSVPKEMREFEGFMAFQLIGDQDPAEIRKFAEEKLRVPLSSVPGVEDVAISGGQEKILKIKIAPEVLQSLGISEDEISRQLLTTSDLNLGHTATGANLKLAASLANIDDLKKMPVKKLASGRMVCLGDLATMAFENATPTRIVRINGRNLVMIELNKEPGVNLLATAQHVNEKIATLKKLLPSGMELRLETDKSEDLRSELDKLQNRSVLSILFIAMLLVLVFRNLKTAMIILASIFLSVFGAIVLFYFSDHTLNILTLAGFTMGFGILVDNAIVVYENIHRRLSILSANPVSSIKNPVSSEQTPGTGQPGFGANQHPASSIQYQASSIQTPGILPSVGQPGFGLASSTKKSAVISAVGEMYQPLLASNLTTLGAFLPVIFLSDNLQLYFQPFVLALGLTLIISLLVSFTLIPTFAFYRFSPRQTETDSSGLHFYKKTLLFCLQHPFLTLLLVIWLFGFPIWLLPAKIEIDDPKKAEVKSEAKIETRQNYERLFQQPGDSAHSADSEKPHDAPAAPKELSWLAEQYNKWWGNEYFSKKVKPTLFKIFGGGSYLFFNEVTKGEIWKPFEGTYISISIDMPNNVDIHKIDAITQDFENRILESAGKVAKMTTNIYHKGYANLRVDIAPAFEFTSFPMQLYSSLVRYGLNIGGVGVQVQGYGPGFYSGLNNQFAQYAVKVKGTNFNTVYALAQTFADQLAQNKRIKNIDLEKSSRWSRKQFEVMCRIDLAKTAQFELDYQQVVNHIRPKIHAASRFHVQIDQQPVRVKLEARSSRQTSIRELRQSPVSHATPVRFADVSTIETQSVLPVIQRENQTYLRLVNYDYIGPYQYGHKLTDLMIKKVPVPYGYSLGMETYNWFSREAQQELLWIILLAVAIVWLVTAALFESWTKPWLVLFAIPLSVIGLFYSFYLFEATFDRGGYASILLLVGIVVNNSILLVNRISQVLATNPPDKMTAIIDAAAERVRPVFMTSVTTIVGLLPLVMFEKTESLWYPLAVGAIGGLVASTGLILVVLPLGYLLLSKIPVTGGDLMLDAGCRANW